MAQDDNNQSHSAFTLVDKAIDRHKAKKQAEDMKKAQEQKNQRDNKDDSSGLLFT